MNDWLLSIYIKSHKRNPKLVGDHLKLGKVSDTLSLPVVKTTIVQNLASMMSNGKMSDIVCFSRGFYSPEV